MISTIFFDWSGVVKDSIAAHLIIINKIFKQFGAQEMTMEELRKRWVQPYMNFYKVYLPHMTQEEQDQAYNKAISESEHPTSFPGMVDLIKKFKNKNIKMIVITSDLNETIIPELSYFDLEGVFDEVVTNVYNKGKVASNLLDKYDLDRSTVLFIGDSNHEIEAGKENGCPTCAVTWGYTSKEVLQAKNPDFVVDTIEELEKVVLSGR
jgi:phosphoglycolate phosphatase-like HAD superfamily hydrolase